MNTKYTLILIILTLTLFNASAQLSGTYTIGGTTPSYATIPLAVTALQTLGVNGPVIMNIRPGTYTGKVDLGNVNGASAVNTITFQSENGDSSSVIITDPASTTGSNFTLHIFGTDFLTFNKVTLSRPGTSTSSTVISIASNSRYFQVRNCVIESDNITGTATSNALVDMPSASLNDSSIIFANNIFRGGSYGLNIQGQSAASPLPIMQITDNQFINQSFRGMQLTFLISPLMRGNNITTNTTAVNFRGISLRKVTGDFKVLENIITGINGTALQFDTCNGTAGNRALVANNFLHTAGTGASRGIYVTISSYIDIYHNSINITTANTGSSAFYILDPGLSSMLNLKNNILVNTGGGTAIRTGAGGFASFSSSNYNDLFVSSNSLYLAIVDVNNYAALSDWKSASSLDSNSISIDPEFISAVDMHIFSASVNNLGTYVSSVPNDIDGQTRSLTTPDIGADEFVPLNDNIGVIKSFLPSSDCGDSNMTVALIISNYGLSSHTGFSVSADITGSVTQLLTQVYTGTLATNQIDTVVFTSTINTYSGGTFTITSYSQLTGDQYPANDTNVTTFTVNGIPNPPGAFTPQQVCINNPLISASPDPGDVVLWYDQPSGGNLLHVGSDFNPPVTTDTVFYIESRKASPTSGCLRITEIQPRVTNFIEITNLSSTIHDYTGWVVAISANNTNINTVNSTYWQLGVMNPGEVLYKTDNSSDNYWGSNIAFSNTGRAWVMIVDPNGVIADFVLINYPEDSLAVLNTPVSGHQITVGSEWSGNGISLCSVATEDNQRIGNNDSNDNSDWSCQTETKGVQNVNLSTTFIECGIGECKSPRIPVNITLLPGVTTNLGNDTIVTIPFSITLDAGVVPGYSWSTGATTQTITVTTLGTYWVTVVDSLGNCTFTDSINISLNVGMNDKSMNDVFKFYPNPATDKLYISAKENLLNSSLIQISDVDGRLVDLIDITRMESESEIDVSRLKDGIYLLRIYSGNQSYIKRFTVIR